MLNLGLGCSSLLRVCSYFSSMAVEVVIFPLSLKISVDCLYIDPAAPSSVFLSHVSPSLDIYGYKASVCTSNRKLLRSCQLLRPHFSTGFSKSIGCLY